MFITILVFLAMLAVLVFVHELGHFLVAKWNKIRVEEFAFGFPPRIVGKKVGETTYAINAIPLGGYVKMYGENETETGPGSFLGKTIWQRFTVMVAGVLMNLILGWIILTALFIVGFQPLFPGTASDPFVHQTATILIEQVAAGSPAATSGLKVGDRIIAAAGQKVATDAEFINQTTQSVGQPMTLTVNRAGHNQTVTLTPRTHPPKGQGAIGIALTDSGNVRTKWYLAPLAGFYETGRIIGLTIGGLGGFVSDLAVHHQVSPNVTGLVGVGVLTGVARRLGFSYLAQLVMLISIGLGVVNLVPLLPLDGGQVAALAYEKVAGHKLSEKQLGTLVTIGLSLVLLLFVVVTYKDIVRFNILGRL